MASEKWRIAQILNSHINKYLFKMTSDIGKELQQAYEDSLREWWKPFVDWSRNKDRTASFSFLREASSQYGEEEEFEAMPDGDNFKAELVIDPSKMNAGLIHEWGHSRKNKKNTPFKDEDAFDMMYVKGVFGFNRGIVKDSWFKTKVSRNKIINKYHFKKDLTKDQLINKISSGKRRIVPPKSKTSPDKIMQNKARTIFSKGHLDGIMDDYLSSSEFTAGLQSNFKKIK